MGKVEKVVMIVNNVIDYKEKIQDTINCVLFYKANDQEIPSYLPMRLEKLMEWSRHEYDMSLELEEE